MAGSYVGGDANGANTATLTTVDWPAGVQSGDIAVLAWTHSDTTTETTPTDFTLLDSGADSTCVNSVYTKVCTGSETGSISLALSGITRQSAALGVFRGYASVNANTEAFEGAVAVQQHDPPSVTPTVANAAIVIITAERLSTGSTSATAPTGFQVRQEFGTGGSGGTFTWMGSDDLAQTRLADVPVDPPVVTHDVAAASAVMRSIALEPDAATVTGVGAAALGFTGTAAGIPETFGVATASLGGTFTTAGAPETFGTAAGAFGFTGTAAGGVVNLSNAFAGAPPVGKFYIGWADGPTTSGHTNPSSDHGTISYGQSVCLDKVSVRHGYSTDTNARPSDTIMDEAINAGLISSQSFKLGTAGNESAGADTILAGGRDADLDIAITRCLDRAPHPIWLTFYHEPGGDWNTTALRTKFRAAFRYIVQYFRDNGNPTNVCWQPILEAPYDFRPSSYSPGGGRNIDWRELHPDWNGGTTGTIADWYTGADRMMDAFGLDIYNPLVGGTSFQDYSNIWQSLLDEFEADEFPYQDYAFNIMEMGWSDVISPDPDWVAYAVETLTAQAQFNITTFTWWDINNDPTPRYCLTTPASDANGDKLVGWQDICGDTNCVVWSTNGVATASFGFTGTASGKPRTPGVATAAFGGTFTAISLADLIADLTFPVILAHRGGGGEAPENTLTAFTQTFAALPKVLGELDLRQNQDGTFVLMHDTTVDRTAGNGETGLVSDYTDAEWATLTVAWPTPPGGTAVAASFWVADVRDAFPTRVLLAEISTDSAATALAAEITADPNLALRVIGSAFNKTRATTLAASGMRVVQLYGAASPDLTQDVINGMWGIALEDTDADLTQTLVNNAHAAGLKVMVYGVDTIATRDTVFALGVDGVITDFPTLLSAVQGAASGSFGGTFTASGVERIFGAAAISFGFTGSAQGIARTFGAASAAFVFTAVATGLNARPFFTFEPPTHEEPIITNVRPLIYYRLTYSTTVFRQGATFVAKRSPSFETLQAAGVEGTDYFIGGHVYTVTEAVANDLTAAGFPVS